MGNATLNRFFSLHYLLPFVLAALVMIHFLTLHDSGSSNPLGISSNLDKTAFHPYFVFKDFVTFFLFLLVLALTVTQYPNLMGHSDNYIPANPMSTPASIVPEWYLLPFYAILRSIPNKLFGVLAMFASLVILLVLPFTDISRIRGNKFRPIMKHAFWSFVVVFILLFWIGSQHPVAPFDMIGRYLTVAYFSFFIIITPLSGIIENSLTDIHLTSTESK